MDGIDVAARANADSCDRLATRQRTLSIVTFAIHGSPRDGHGAAHFLLIGAIAHWLADAMVPLALIGLIRCA